MKQLSLFLCLSGILSLVEAQASNKLCSEKGTHSCLVTESLCYEITYKSQTIVTEFKAFCDDAYGTYSAGPCSVGQNTPPFCAGRVNGYNLKYTSQLSGKACPLGGELCQ